MKVTALALLMGSLFLPAQIPAAVQACEGGLDGMVSDFNADGHADAAVGDPFRRVGDAAGAGAVTIMYGSTDGRVGEGERVRLTQDTPSIRGEAERGDQFGFDMEAADLDGDGCTDLAVSAPGDGAGQIAVLYGSPKGLGQETLWIGQGTSRVPGTPEAGDQFGHRLSAAPAKGADDAVVVVGVPHEDIRTVRDAGAVVSVRLTRERELASARWFDQSTPGVSGVPEPGDLFGSDIEVLQASGSSGRWDLVVGTPYEDIGAVRNAGSMTLVEDLAEAVAEHRAVTWTQDSAGVSGDVEAGDLFGTDPEHVVTPEGLYLAIGVPGEDLRGASNGGMVQVFRGAGEGLRPQRVLHQDLAGASDAIENNDFFGNVLEGVERPVAGGHARLVVGLPSEDLGTRVDAGAVQSFSLDAPGIEDRWLSQDAPQVPAGADSRDGFGFALGSAGAQGEHVLLVGVPWEDDQGVVHVLPFGGSGRLWYPEVGANRFGFSLAGHR
ncbi:FG-GAP and VCBS repeat-containing protein [Nonomuraea sp. SYSU D8015]|uniref:FG-GAP and VCBS repeat-containing protein n=1 Tax=Nonomuraea sp. SYSU D8015 TaxID=2593644 RepID=UPI001660FAA0|nr:FG-GAP and VCBS repeat-containing protein [Nonomuraea sp. SYSU D8015]